MNLDATWRVFLEGSRDKRVPEGLDAWWSLVEGEARRWTHSRGRLMARAAHIVDLGRSLASVTEAALAERIDAARALFRRGRDGAADLDEAFALVSEVAFRQTGQRPYAVQVAGALAMTAGCVAEMATGEGKTLTASLPAAIAGWRGKGCHVITVNDYLAQRDADLLRKIYAACGLSVAAIQSGMERPDRRAAYAADVTYGTSKEVTADFLKDRLTLGGVPCLTSALVDRIVGDRPWVTGGLLQRGLAVAIVDEIDSVLIDESVTPLILSGEAENPEGIRAFREAAELADRLEPATHYRINFTNREIALTQAGKDALAAGVETRGGFWSGARRREELVVQALVATHFFKRDEQYVVQDGKVVIVDEFTGRRMPDRSWRHGLHQLIEAREKLEIQPPKDTFARISFQRFFRLYERLCGMTGTAAEVWRELWQVYRCQVVPIPTNHPPRRRVLPMRLFAYSADKHRAVIETLQRLHAERRPVLIGTRSVAASEALSRQIAALRLPHQVLNAGRPADEAQVVERAGQAGAITVATNMAGRGTDIKLGDGVAALGGLHVISTECNESARIDRQLFGRCARQGDPGSAQAIVGLEDELIVRHGGALARAAAALSAGELGDAWARRVTAAAQASAESAAAASRRDVLRADDWLDEVLGFSGKPY